MKRRFLFFTVIITFSISCFAQAPNTWVRKADFLGIKRSSAVSFSIGNMGYIGTGGYDSSSNKNSFRLDLNDFWEWNQISNTWSQKASFPGVSREMAIGFSIGKKGYIGVGYSYNNSGPGPNDFWEWDQATNIWTQKAKFMGSAGFLAVGFSIGVKGYIGTGFGFGQVNEFWEWDLATNTWTQKANFAGVARSGAIGFSIGTKGYIGLGDANAIKCNDFWEWDQASNIWIQKANFGGAPRWLAVSFSIGTKGYVGTGTGSSGYFNDFWEWDQPTNLWSKKADVGFASQAIAFSIGSKGYVSTGYILNNYLLEYSPNGVATMLIGIISPSTICAGSSISIPYTAYNTFNTSNIFTAQLSDSSGSFISPVNIGSVTSTISGSINATIPANTLAGNKYRIRVISNNPLVIGPDNGVNITITNQSTLNLKCFVQGYYINGGNMKKVLYNENVDTNSSSTNVDTVTVELHSALQPYAVVESYKGVLQTNGTLTCYFSCSVTGHSYFIAVKHRNANQTWSAVPVAISTVTNYDFTTAANKAYGNNMVQMETGRWAFYSGDMNQDENIDILDFPIIQYDIVYGLSGYYATDLNGDGNVDILDYPIYDGNSLMGVYSMHP